MLLSSYARGVHEPPDRCRRLALRDVVDHDARGDRYEARFYAWLNGSHWDVDLIERAGNVIGYTAHQRRQDHFDRSIRVLFIRHFFIERDQRRIGIGRTAYETLIDQRTQNLPVTLDILPTSPDALGFWRKLGFETYYTVLKKESPQEDLL